jgi:4-amino-4-deoxy-L-arabinose transferase-like glycosyltransferase
LSSQYYPSGWIYTANHPPLYYMLMTPVYWVTEGASPATQHYAMRAASLIFGLLTVVLAYRLARTLFPGDTFLAITVPSFVAFQPQVSYEAAMLNNDILCIALVSFVLYLLAVGIRDRFPWRTCALTGGALGLALLAKGTSVIVIPLIAFAVFLGVGGRQIKEWLPRGGLIAAIGGLIASPWYIFLYRTYGNLDGFDQIAQLQIWNYLGESKPSILDQLWSREFAVMRWRETWGEFGWRRIQLGDGLLWAIGVGCLIALAGFVLWTVRVVRLRQMPGQAATDPLLYPARWQLAGVLLLLATCLVAYYAILQFGTRFSLTQARYYFPAINAVALILMLGLRSLIPVRYHHLGQAGILASLILMNVVIYTQYVIPYWHF